MSITTGTVRANDVEFAYLESGEGPLALCLHGFPDTAHTWRHLLPALADQGYRAVAPFMRGYAPTAVPADGAYQTGALSADANALHEALGGDGEAVIIGHDWGAGATYGAAAHQPERWRRVVTMSVPPMGIMAGAFFRYDQVKRSFYMFFFMNPLADAVVPMHDHDFIARLWEDWSPGYEAEGDVAHVREALADPANLSAALGYYRATFDPSLQQDEYAEVQMHTALPNPQPTLYLHGANDGCIGAELLDGVEAFLPGEGSRFELVADAGHFLQLERPETVNNLILGFLAEG